MNDFIDMLKRFDGFAIAVIIIAAWFINSNVNSKFESLQGQMMDIDRRLCRIEGAYMMSCVKKDVSNKEKEA